MHCCCCAERTLWWEITQNATVYSCMKMAIAESPLCFPLSATDGFRWVSTDSFTRWTYSGSLWLVFLIGQIASGFRHWKISHVFVLLAENKSSDAWPSAALFPLVPTLYVAVCLSWTWCVWLSKCFGVSWIYIRPRHTLRKNWKIIFRTEKWCKNISCLCFSKPT